MGEHVLQKNLSRGRAFLAGGHVLLEDMSYGRICLMEGYVLLEACLRDNMSYRRMFIWTTYNKYYREDMSYWKTYLTGHESHASKGIYAAQTHQGMHAQTHTLTHLLTYTLTQTNYSKDIWGFSLFWFIFPFLVYFPCLLSLDFDIQIEYHISSCSINAAAQFFCRSHSCLE